MIVEQKGKLVNGDKMLRERERERERELVSPITGLEFLIPNFGFLVLGLRLEA